MIDFSLTEEQRALQQMVRSFAQGEVAPRIKELDADHIYDPGILRRMGELGILGLCFPQKYNGGGLDYLSLALACEELERVDTSLRVVMSVHVGLCGLGLLQWGTEEQKGKYLTRLATGELIGAFGLTEPGHGSDAAHLETRAARDGDGYVLNGEKTWISLADVADVFLVFARTGDDRGARGISAFLVERGWPGLETFTIKGKLGVRAGNTGGLRFSDLRVPAANRVGEEGEGFKIAMSCLDNGRFTVAAGAVGIIQACLDASLRYCSERQTFGQPIGRHQLVQRMIAHMVRGLESSRYLVYRAAWLKNRGERNTRETALAKWHATESAFRAANDAVQIHGAYGYSNEFPVERYLRNARGGMIYEGTSQILELLLAEYALGYREDRPLRRELPGWPFEEDDLV